jgi:hypothetical protein
MLQTPLPRTAFLQSQHPFLLLRVVFHFLVLSAHIYTSHALYTQQLPSLLPNLRTSLWNPLSRPPHFGSLSNICAPSGGGLGGLLEHVLVIFADNGQNCVAGS